jgi:hypothetical protein
VRLLALLPFPIMRSEVLWLLVVPTSVLYGASVKCISKHGLSSLGACLHISSLYPATENITNFFSPCLFQSTDMRIPTLFISYLRQAASEGTFSPCHERKSYIPSDLSDSDSESGSSSSVEVQLQIPLDFEGLLTEKKRIMTTRFLSLLATIVIYSKERMHELP